jgi:nicotinamidase-related amidase
MSMKSQTLLSLAGAPARTTNFKNSCLILIDVQNEYIDGVLPLPGAAKSIANCKKVLDRARASKIPVVHVKHHGRPGGPVFNPESEKSEIVAELAPATGEAVIVKSMPNSFVRTDLEATLRALDCEELIIAGFMTHMCVSSTTRAAVDLGFTCSVISDATATRDLPDPTGTGNIDAETVHRAALAALQDRFCNVVETEQCVFTEPASVAAQ